MQWCNGGRYNKAILETWSRPLAIGRKLVKSGFFGGKKIVKNRVKKQKQKRVSRICRPTSICRWRKTWSNSVKDQRSAADGGSLRLVTQSLPWLFFCVVVVGWFNGGFLLFFFFVIVCLLGSASFFDSPTLPLKWTNLEAENLSAALAELCRSTEYFLHKPILCWRLFQPVLSTFSKPFFKKKKNRRLSFVPHSLSVTCKRPGGPAL